jgi:hypothetical protein
VQAARVAALASDVGRQVVGYAQVELVSLLASDLPRAREFVATRLGALAAASEPARRLRETLRAFLAAGGRSGRAAKELYVHQNTVVYRVKRAEELLGGRVSDEPLELMCALLSPTRSGPRCSSRSSHRRADPLWRFAKERADLWPEHPWLWARPGLPSAARSDHADSVTTAHPAVAERATKTPPTKETVMETALWIVQVLLAAIFLVTGTTKLTQPRLKMAAGPMRWAADVTDAQFRTIGLLEVSARSASSCPRRSASHRP